MGDQNTQSRVAAMLGQQLEGAQGAQWLPKSYPELQGEEYVRKTKVCKSVKQIY